MVKANDAFRNIREASEELDVPQHVLRFWETKFPEIQPLKRGGRRRYYRPEDLSLLTTIRDLLYVQGYTIRGVQRLLREGGIEAPPAPSEDMTLPPDMEAEDQREAEREAAEDVENAAAFQTLSEEAIQTRELFQTITPVVPQAENSLASMLSVPEGSEDPVDRQREEREQIIGRLAVIHADLAGAMARFDQAVAAEL
ncbi:MAG: MerR family transcriptional regulator [Alphaproteobacteria bacterium TMED89]|nr:transcriptional regulator [Rhodospirillaceae bacterium]RPH15198.1 MAG: MerR family transcriptional regulator [Alphaproteobacteria bacterium TMED89]